MRAQIGQIKQLDSTVILAQIVKVEKCDLIRAKEEHKK